jgi:hypothetical protein
LKLKNAKTKKKSCVQIEKPEIITLFNKSMGGVDKINQFISTHGTFMDIMAHNTRF